MSQKYNVVIARDLIRCIGRGDDPGKIAEAFHDDLIFEIHGDQKALSWADLCQVRNGLVSFLNETRQIIESAQFEVESIPAKIEPSSLVILRRCR